MSWEIRQGDALALLREMPAESVRCCVTSPPYWGLRDYGHAGQLGLERTPEEYVSRMVELFREVRRVLAKDGTLWCNLGDCYANDDKWGGSSGGKHVSALHGQSGIGRGKRDTGLKPKDLVGIPWRVAFALQADGWWLRSDIVWAKPNPMPESVTDRPTKAHESLFLLAKSERYYYDAEAIAEPMLRPEDADGTMVFGGKNKSLTMTGNPARDRMNGKAWVSDKTTRNKRDVWTVATKPFPEAHFATFPEALVEPCILAGSAPGDLVLDPFAGSCTVGVVALRHGRRFLGLELNPSYVEMGRRRIAGPLFANVDRPAVASHGPSDAL